MIVRLTGTLSDIESDRVIIERDGLAREVLVPHYAIGELAAYRGRQVTLHTQEFYEGNQASGHLTPRVLGFVHPEDRTFFRKFTSVKGIGPRKALKALAEPVRRVASWIEQADCKALSKLPGIGPRAAELIVAELKGKLGDLAMGGETISEEIGQWTPSQRDALDVLIAWGDGRNDAQRWLQRAAQVRPDLDTADEWVRAAYKVKAGVEG